MSDILIKDVERPKDCYVCHSLIGFRFPACPLNGLPDMTWLLTKRHSDCPLIELPPHGDLVDRSLMLGACYELEREFDMEKAFEVIESAPTVLEASKAKYE